MSSIERAFGLRGSEKHKDDATSVKLWVEEMKEKCNDNPVLLHKPQGEASSDTALHIKDFALGIQTPLQAQMLKRFGPNKIICIDAIHTTLTSSIVHGLAFLDQVHRSYYAHGTLIVLGEVI